MIVITDVSGNVLSTGGAPLSGISSGTVTVPHDGGTYFIALSSDTGNIRIRMFRT